MRITATLDGDPFGKCSFSLDKDIEPGRMREAAVSAGMGADFDAGIQFARDVGAGGKESWRSTIRE